MPQNELDLLRLLHSTEHTFVERKTSGDSKDWVKTVVAFANTLSPDQEGVLFIGATDKGGIESHPVNLDKLQKSLSERTQAIYPPVYYTTKSVQEDGKECLVVIVPGSSLKPHFAGPLYLRDGSQSIVANTHQYETLLASRVGKVYELQKWINKTIKIREFSRSSGVAYVMEQRAQDATVIDVNQFFLTVFYNNRKFSYPLSRLDINYDHVVDCLEIQVTPPQI